MAATPSADTLLHQADLTGPLAIAVGSEKHGLTDQWLDQAAIKIRIPMFGRADSLNVATSAAIVCYEAVRQGGGVRGRVAAQNTLKCLAPPGRAIPRPD